LRDWGPLPLILMAAAFMYAGYMPYHGYEPDMNYFQARILFIRQSGLLNFYAFRTHSDLTYPPLAAAVMGVTRFIEPQVDTAHSIVTNAADDFALTPAIIVSIKVIPVLADFILVVVVYVWLRRRPVLRWLIPLLLALSPTLVIDSAW